MRIRIIDDRRSTAPCTTRDILPGKEYSVIEVVPKWGWYRIIDESGEDYMYPPELFEIVEE